MSDIFCSFFLVSSLCYISTTLAKNDFFLKGEIIESAIMALRMELYIAGTEHYDPLCRMRLIKWLKRINLKNSTPPAFIAVEGNEQAYQKILQCREQFRQMLKGEFLHVPSEISEALVQTIYFEADTYLEVFRDAKIIWLDEGKRIPQSLNDFARTRLNIYKSYIDQEDPLRKISESRWNLEDWKKPPTNPLDEPDYERDNIFFRKVSDAIANYNGSWAIAIVGAKHAAAPGRSFRIQLEESGILCRVEILNNDSAIQFTYSQKN